MLMIVDWYTGVATAATVSLITDFIYTFHFNCIYTFLFSLDISLN